MEYGTLYNNFCFISLAVQHNLFDDKKRDRVLDLDIGIHLASNAHRNPFMRFPGMYADMLKSVIFRDKI